MSSKRTGSLEPFIPDLQISFSTRLEECRKKYLGEALKAALSSVKITEVDQELGQFVEDRHLKKLAQQHIRGEVFFPIPKLIYANPYLLGYYRLLNGLSQKEFYGRKPYGKFKRMEESGIIPKGITPDLVEELCISLIETSGILLDNINMLSVDIATHLQLLTLGAQLRGSNNNVIGGDATSEIVTLLKEITGDYIQWDNGKTFAIENDSKTTIIIEFKSDPDVTVIAQLGEHVRPILSIEIKGGKDVSNIHNRIGEAEKSHLKAKQDGFREFWTLHRAQIDLEQARKESQTTSLFFNIDEILDEESFEHDRFKRIFCSHVGITPK
jgi:hypothetical protein